MIKRLKNKMNKKGGMQWLLHIITDDACMANLPGVIYACCGHGNGDGYAMDMWNFLMVECLEVVFQYIQNKN